MSDKSLNRSFAMSDKSLNRSFAMSDQSLNSSFFERKMSDSLIYSVIVETVSK